MRARSPRILLFAMLSLVIATSLFTAGCASLPGIDTSFGTPTSSMLSPDLAVLGGTPQAFTDTFGPPYHNPAFYAFTTSTGDRILITLGILHNLATGSVLVQAIILEPADNRMWDTAAAQKLYHMFLPPDATFTRNGTGSNGVYLVYASTQLANTFPAQVFVDSSGQQLPPGTFEVVCNNKIMPSDHDANGCALVLGEWPRS